MPVACRSSTSHDDRVWVLLNRLRMNGGSDMSVYIQRLCRIWCVAMRVHSSR
jgi:hypothetical protein